VNASFAAPILVRLERQTAAPRVLVTSGFTFEGALRIDTDVAALVGIRPGADDVRFTCDVRLCTASTYAARRPGFYALVATLADGTTVTTPNAFYIEDTLAKAPPLIASLEGDTVTLSAPVTNAAWVEHGGAAGPLTAVVPPSARALDVIYTQDGALYRVAIISEAADTPITPPATSGNTRGCNGCQQSDDGQALWLIVFSLCALAMKRHARTAKKV
jgi:hypothetical protein